MKGCKRLWLRPPTEQQGNEMLQPDLVAALLVRDVTLSEDGGAGGVDEGQDEIQGARL